MAPSAPAVFAVQPTRRRRVVLPLYQNASSRSSRLLLSVIAVPLWFARNAGAIPVTSATAETSFIPPSRQEYFPSTAFVSPFFTFIFGSNDRRPSYAPDPPWQQAGIHPGAADPGRQKVRHAPVMTQAALASTAGVSGSPSTK